MFSPSRSSSSSGEAHDADDDEGGQDVAVGCVRFGMICCLGLFSYFDSYIDCWFTSLVLKFDC